MGEPGAGARALLDALCDADELAGEDRPADARGRGGSALAERRSSRRSPDAARRRPWIHTTHRDLHGHARTRSI